MTESTFPSPRSRLAAVIAEARRRGRRRHFALGSIGLLALLVGGGVWAGLSFTGGESATPPPVPAGFHAVRARGPVEHLLAVSWNRMALNGTPRGPRTSYDYELWFDARGGVVRERTWVAGQVHDDASSCPCGFPFDRYWPVDPTKFVRRPGTAMFGGREVIWIGRRQTGGFAPYSFHVGEWIALDARTHDPVATRNYTSQERLSAEYRIVRRLPDVDPRNFWFVLPPVRPAPRPPGPPVFRKTRSGS
jgi:hypothetical protein